MLCACVFLVLQYFVFSVLTCELVFLLISCDVRSPACLFCFLRMRRWFGVCLFGCRFEFPAVLFPRWRSPIFFSVVALLLFWVFAVLCFLVSIFLFTCVFLVFFHCGGCVMDYCLFVLFSHVGLRVVRFWSVVMHFVIFISHAL